MPMMCGMGELLNDFPFNRTYRGDSTGKAWQPLKVLPAGGQAVPKVVYPCRSHIVIASFILPPPQKKWVASCNHWVFPIRAKYVWSHLASREQPRLVDALAIAPNKFEALRSGVLVRIRTS